MGDEHTTRTCIITSSPCINMAHLSAHADLFTLFGKPSSFSSQGTPLQQVYSFFPAKKVWQPSDRARKLEQLRGTTYLFIGKEPKEVTAGKIEGRPSCMVAYIFMAHGPFLLSAFAPTHRYHSIRFKQRQPLLPLGRGKSHKNSFVVCKIQFEIMPLLYHHQIKISTPSVFKLLWLLIFLVMFDHLYYLIFKKYHIFII
jgi:hypothetical protein